MHSKRTTALLINTGSENNSFTFVNLREYLSQRIFFKKDNLLEFTVLQLYPPLRGYLTLFTCQRAVSWYILENIWVHFSTDAFLYTWYFSYLLTMPSFVVSSFISLKSLKLNRRINHKRNLSNTVAKHFFFPLTDIFKMYFNVIYFITHRE